MAHILFLSDSLESIGKGLKHFKQGSDMVISAFSKDSVVRREDGGETRPEAERQFRGCCSCPSRRGWIRQGSSNAGRDNVLKVCLLIPNSSHSREK